MTSCPALRGCYARVAGLIIVLSWLPLTAQAPNKQADPTQPAAFRAKIVQMSYWAKPSKADEVLQWRIHACDVLQKLGVPRGRVFKYVQGPRATVNADHPDVVWQAEFSDQASFERYEEAAGSSPEFREVQQHMSTLTQKAERRYFEVQ